MSQSKSTSLREYALKYTLIIFMVILIATVIHYVAFSFYLKGGDANEQQKQLESSSQQITHLIEFYQSIVDKMASQEKVLDLIHFGSYEQVQAWANEMQHLLPESIGFAVFDNRNRVKGVPAQLRLSKRCLDDMNKRFKGEYSSYPPVHSRIEELAHFDVISPVIHDGEYTGVVFSSFSLNIIQHLIENMETNNKSYRLVTRDGYVIAKSRQFDMSLPGIYRSTVDGSDWTIEMSVHSPEKRALLTSLLISNVAVFILVSLIMYFSIRRVFHLVLQDFEVLGWMMNTIREGNYDEEQTRKPMFRESQGVIRFMQHTASELIRYQDSLKHQSTTDELTGLFNRRVLNQKIENAMQLATHDHSIFLVILDIDFFKEINDSYGHDVGDFVLKILAEGIRNSSKATDVCTRAGGDEFIVLLMDYTQDQVQAWYQQLSTEVGQKIDSYNDEHGYQIQFGISGGCSLIRNNDNKGSILKRADDALYEAKSGGRNNLKSL